MARNSPLTQKVARRGRSGVELAQVLDVPEHRGELIDPVLAASLEAVEAPCLEALELLGVGSLLRG